VDWEAIKKQEVPAPYVPPISGGLDSSNFDDYEEEEAIPEYTGSQGHFENF
jgi:hypothetical protein